VSPAEREILLNLIRSRWWAEKEFVSASRLAGIGLNELDDPKVANWFKNNRRSMPKKS
jgi:hypothetical protein